MTQTALITGASSGIGRALAVEFARRGYDLVLVARNRSALEDVGRAVSDSPRGTERVRAPQVHIIAADLSEWYSARAIVNQLDAAGTQIDVLVNNAGFALQGEFVDLALDEQIAMIQLNVTTLTELTRLLLPSILARKAGGVLNVASTAAFQAGPLMSVYYATKAFVLSFTEGIAEEVSGTAVKVSCLCPGATETGFASRAGAQDTNLFNGEVMSAEEVARDGVDGWNAGHVIVIPGFRNRAGAFTVRLLPRSLVRRIVKRMNSPADR